MNGRCWPLLLTAILWGALSIFCLSGLEGIPFHPDESTQIYMSADFETMLSDPLSLSWTPGQENDPRMRYRLIDSPLTRFLIGAARRIAGQPPLQVDWDWTTSWEENRLAGALPNRKLLLTGRLALAGLLPACLALIFLTAKNLGGLPAGWMAMLFFGLNSLVLLHGRRSMAEGALLFGIVFFVWSLTKNGDNPWLIGLSLGIAINAKQTAFVLLPAGLLAVVWPINPQPSLIKRLSPPVVGLIAAVVFTTALLNPVYWRCPTQALYTGLAMRQELATRQYQMALALQPGQALPALQHRLAALVVNLFLSPPAFAESANYQANTAELEHKYLQNPLHRLMRNIPGGAALFILASFGIVSGLLQMHNFDTTGRRRHILLYSAGGLVFAGLLIAVPLSWQRYVIPATPFVCIWMACGLNTVLLAFKNFVDSNKARQVHH